MAALAVGVPLMPLEVSVTKLLVTACRVGCIVACGPDTHSASPAPLWIWGNRSGNYRVCPDLASQDLSACSCWSEAAGISIFTSAVQLQGQK